MNPPRVVAPLTVLGLLLWAWPLAGLAAAQPAATREVPTLATDDDALATALATLSAKRALEVAAADGRPLVLALLCAGEPESERIDATCWNEPRVVAWSRDVGRIVRVETPEQLELAADFGVEQVPTLVWLQDGEVLRRSEVVTPGWLAHSLLHPAGVPTTDADLVCQFFDEWAPPSTRLVQRSNLWERLPPEQRLADLRWVWDHWLWTHNHRENGDLRLVSKMVLGDTLDGLAHIHEGLDAGAVRAGFADELEAAVDAATYDEVAWLRWLVVGPALVDRARVAAHIENNLPVLDLGRLPTEARRRLYGFCLRDASPVAAGLLAEDVEASCRAVLERTSADVRRGYGKAIEPIRGMYDGAVGAFLDESLTGEIAERLGDAGRRADVIELLERALAAGRHDEARRAAALLLAEQDTATARLDLVQCLFAADGRWQAAARRDDAFGRFVAELPRPREAFAAEARGWLAEVSAQAAGAQASRAAALARWLEGE